MPSAWNAFACAIALALLPGAVSGSNLDCTQIPAGGEFFNFKKLGGEKDVHWTRQKAPGVANTTFTIDICNKLVKKKGKTSQLECPMGTQICAIERHYGVDDEKEKDPTPASIIPIAGEYTFTDGRHLDPHFTRFKPGDSESDPESSKEGVSGELNGGYYDGQKQKAVIEFICNKAMDGTEGFEQDPARMTDASQYSSMKNRRQEDGEDGEYDGGLPNLDEGKALQFISYRTENDVGVLRLEWNTKYACEGAMDEYPDGERGGWGWFTWFLIIVFLLAAAYIIFGSWLNYNRYGARGWDLIPHGDTIRDIPYVLKDLVSNLGDRLKGHSYRGGYSAV